MQSVSLYRALLRCYPGAFREEYGAEMELVFREEWQSRLRCRDWLGVSYLWLQALSDVLIIAPQEHYYMVQQDVRYAFRTFRANPGFALVAVLSLALGIGANSAIFGLLNGALYSALPVPNPEQLVILSDPASAGVSIGAQTEQPRALLTYQEFEQLRSDTNSFTGMFAAESAVNKWRLRFGATEERVNGRLVSGEYFRVLDVPALLGRTFTREEDKAIGGAPYAVISYDYWQRRFGGDRGVLGRTFSLQGTSYSIIGVTPPGFFGETVGQTPDVWLPMSMEPLVKPGRDWLHQEPGSIDKVMWLHVFGRLKPGVTAGQAQANVSVIFKQIIEASYPMLSGEKRKEFLNQTVKVQSASHGASTLRERFAEPLFVLFAVVGAVLLIACANLANLLLARATARQREISVRMALGAGRGRLVRQLLTESLLLSLMGGVAGLFIARIVGQGLTRLASSPDDPIQLAAVLDAKVLAFTAFLTILTALLFGIAPALRATRLDVGARLKEQGRGLTSSAARLHLGKLLVVGQIALSLVLLVGAGLFLRTLINLQTVDLGYDRERLLLLNIDPTTAGYKERRALDLYRDLLERYRTVPGVREVTYSENGLFGGVDSADAIEVEGYKRTGQGDRGSRYDKVGPEYFSTLRIPMLRGREIGSQDREGTTPVCVINEAFAKKFFADRNPIGLHVTITFGPDRFPFEVVGVARDARDRSLRAAVVPRFYLAMQQSSKFAPMSVNYEIRTTAEPTALTNSLRKVTEQFNSNLPVADVRSLEDLVDRRLAQDRMIARLSAAFGTIALVLAALGLYGVLSYGVAQRTSEIGIRLALGAQPARVLSMVMRETSVVVVLGLAVGCGVAFACTRLVESKLFGLAPTDPGTFAAATLVLLMVAALAGFVPAYRAARVDPLTALRHE